MVSLTNFVVVSYTIFGYLFGILVLGSDEFVAKYLHLTWSLPLRIASSLFLMAHTLSFSGYLHHDLAHNSVFDTRALNHYFCMYMDWMNGACYWSVEELRAQHLKHHMSKVDFDVMSPTLAVIQSFPLLKATLLVCGM